MKGRTKSPLSRRSAAALLPALLLAFGVTRPAAAGTWVVPGVASSTGRAGTRFESQLFVLNAGPSEADVTFGLVPGSGSAPVPAVRRVRAGETIVLENVLKELWGLDGTFGTLTASCGSPLVLAGATRNVASPEGTYGVGLAPLAAGEEIAAGETGWSAWLTHVAGASGSRSNVNVALLVAGSSATVEVRDGAGALVGTATVSSATPVTWQRSVGEIVGGAVEPFVAAGYATLKVTGGKAAGYVVVVDNATGDGILSPFALPASGETDALLDGAARGPGAKGTRWTTGLRILNPGDAPLRVQLDAAGISPSPASWRAEREVAARAVLAVDDLVGTLGGVEGSAGGVRVRASGAISLLASTSTPAPAPGPGSFGVAQPLVPTWGGLSGPGQGTTLAGLVHGGTPSFRTNVALLAGADGLRGSLVLRDPAGRARSTAAVALGSSEWRQRSLPEWVGVSDAAEGSRVDLSVESGTAVAVATVIDDGTGDALLRSAAPLPTSCSGASPAGSASAGTTLSLGESAGRVRPLLGVNIGPIPSGIATADLTSAYHAAGVTQVRTHDYYGPLDMAVIYPNQEADPASPSSYSFATSDAVFARILAGAFEPFLRLGDSYRTSASLPLRPTNPGNWVKAAVEVVRRYDDASRWAGRPLRYVEIWNEPDNSRFWDGTHQQFFDLFVAAAAALKSAFPHLLVGGPAFAPSGALAPQGQAMTRGLLASLAASHGVIDFLSYHVYSNDPDVYRQVARFYRAELDRAGFLSVPLVIDEWNTETRSSTTAEALALRTGGRGASILSAAHVVLQEEGVVASCLYRGPDPAMTAPEFYGIFYADGTPKRSALALGLWKRLADHPERLAVTAKVDSGPGVRALAGRNASGETVLLVANPSASPTSVRVVPPDGGISCTRVDEVSDASSSVLVRTVAGSVVDVPAWSTLLVSLRP